VQSQVEKARGPLCLGWIFRQSDKNAQLAVDTYGGGPMGELVFLKDWSPWILCDVCYRKVID
jgi:hypothetical protein